MALLLTSAGLQRQAKAALALNPETTGAVLAAGTTLAASAFLSHVRRGRLLADAGAIGGGGALFILAKKNWIKSIGVGLGTAGIWDLFMKKD